MSIERDYMGPTDRLDRRMTLTWVLIAVSVGVFALNFLWAGVISKGSPALERALVLRPLDVINSLQVWKLFTHLFYHPPPALFGLLFNMLALFFFGRMVEEQLGPRKYAVLFFGGGLLSALVFTILGYFLFPGDSYLGPAGAIMAILMVAALTSPNAQVIFFVFPMRLKHLVLIYVIADIYFTVMYMNLSSLSHLAGGVWGFAFFKLQDRIAGKLARWDEEAESRSARKREVDDREFDLEVDRILEKIAVMGMGALSSKEKRVLDQASKRKRTR